MDAWNARAAAPEDTRRLGERLGRACRGGEGLLLSGGLGAGKTCFAQGLARGLGVPAAVVVASPTFVLHNQYEGRLRFDHVDLYRLGDGGADAAGDAPGPAPAAALAGLGIEEWWTAPGGVCAVEWPEVFGAHAPSGGLAVRFDADGGGGRTIAFRARDAAHAALLDRLADAAREGRP